MFCLYCIEKFDIDECKHYYRPQTYWEPEEREVYCPKCKEEIAELEEYEKSDILEVIRSNKKECKDINHDIQYLVDRYVEIVLEEKEN